MTTTSTEDWSPVEIERKLLEITNRISNSVRVCSDRYQMFLAADRDYDRAFAKAFLDHEGPQTEKRYAAELATTQERDVRDIADAAYRYAKELREALNGELDAYRSIGASIRETYRVAGVGER